MSLYTPNYNLQAKSGNIFLLWWETISSFLTMRTDLGNRSHSINMCWMNKWIINKQVNKDDKGDRCYRQESRFFHPFIHKIFIGYLLLPGIVRGAACHLGNRDQQCCICLKNNFCLMNLYNKYCMPVMCQHYSRAWRNSCEEKEVLFLLRFYISLSLIWELWRKRT